MLRTVAIGDFRSSVQSTVYQVRLLVEVASRALSPGINDFYTALACADQLAAALAGSIGIAPTANINPSGETPSMFEPIHGSAPDIAGQGLANPLAAILSFEMALRWSLGRPEAADRLQAAVIKALENGARTRDLGGGLSTVQMGDAVLAALGLGA